MQIRKATSLPEGMKVYQLGDSSQAPQAEKLIKEANVDYIKLTSQDGKKSLYAIGQIDDRKLPNGETSYDYKGDVYRGDKPVAKDNTSTDVFNANAQRPIWERLVKVVTAPPREMYPWMVPDLLDKLVKRFG